MVVVRSSVEDVTRELHEAVPNVNGVSFVSKDERQANWGTRSRVKDGKCGVAVTGVGGSPNDVEESKVVRVSNFLVGRVVIVIRDR